jgi:hypothetical protein
MPTSGKAQNCSHSLSLPSNAVFCRAFGGRGGYNLDSRVVMTADQAGERDGRTIPWHTAIRETA